MTVVKENQKTFVSIAPWYDRIIWGSPYYLNQREAEIKAIKRFIPGVEGGNKGFALDVGCGTGDQTLLLLKKGYFVIGLDPASEMIALARTKTKKYKERVSFFCGDLEELEDSDNKFQVVIVCGSVLNLLTDWRKFLGKIARSLSPKGILIISLDNLISLENFGWLLRSLLKKSKIKEWLIDLKNVLRDFTEKKMHVERWSFFLWERKIPIKTYSLRLKEIKKILADFKIDIDEIWGVNFLTCLLPSVLDSSVDLTPQRRKSSKLFDFFRKIDDKIRFVSYPLASNVILIGYKEKR